MWSMLEERRVLQASVAHDLRNPIAIMTGYVEYKSKSNSPFRKTEGIGDQVFQNAVQQFPVKDGPPFRHMELEITFDGQDELGQLCTAFEKMRQTLYENNRQMWSMLEERRATSVF